MIRIISDKDACNVRCNDFSFLNLQKQSIQAQVASESAHELDEIQRAIAAESQSSRGSASIGNEGASVVGGAPSTVILLCSPPSSEFKIVSILTNKFKIILKFSGADRNATKNHKSRRRWKRNVIPWRTAKRN